jgi:hypothetical protein
MSNANVSLIVQETNSAPRLDQQQAIRSYEKKLDFIKTALKLSDKKLDAIKVEDLGKKMIEAQEMVTVGMMRGLLKKEKIKVSLIEIIANKFRGFVHSFQPRSRY